MQPKRTNGSDLGSNRAGSNRKMSDPGWPTQATPNRQCLAFKARTEPDYDRTLTEPDPSKPTHLNGLIDQTERGMADWF